MSVKILVMEGITERGMQVLEAEGWTVDVRKTMPPAELAAVVGPYHALMIRSGTQVTAEVLDAAKSLRIIGRPGVGVDNVDLDAATRRGVVVMNSPAGNVASTAELTLALLLAMARNVPQADAAIKAERWDRKSFAGVELQGKHIGIVGLGRIGREVAARCRAFGMEVAAYDPFVAPAVAEELRIPLLSFEQLLQGSDFLTLHTTLTRETRHLLGREALARAKPGIRIVNAARGELVDEEALLAALESGRVAGAALDVHAQEPPRDWRLARHPRVVATPHVGAATAEAQERVGTDIAVQVRDFLKGGLIQHAVNFFSLTGDVYDRVRPAMDLAERLGLFLAQVCDGSMERVEVGLYGDFREIDVKPILSAAVYGVLQPVLAEGVTLVNARGLAAERGIDVLESTSTARVAFSNLLVLRLKTSECDFSVAGTLFGRNHLRLVDVDGVEVDAIPQGNLLYVKNDDTPGVVGHLGNVLGERSINIARMTVGREPGSGRAVMIIEVDSAVPAEAIAAVATIPGVREARSICLESSLPGRPPAS
ncbi:MAG: phosphoglycerate dehydrogenase [Acidobacteria bacterium]|nr:MAG: phosphoglycerate dehydrogenase [Acidobacteriota bacterium]